MKTNLVQLQGKLLNTREATHKQILENKEINDLIKIIGLQYKKKYETMDDLKSLRYVCLRFFWWLKLNSIQTSVDTFYNKI